MPIRPLLFSIIACFFWGTIFIVPLFLSDFCCVDIALGRYLMFGILSLGIFAFMKEGPALLKAHWKKALLFALIMNLGYYTTLALGVRYSSAALTALILGTAPLSIAFSSFLKEKGPLKEMIVPGLIIFLGLFLMNMDALSDVLDLSTFMFGAFFAILSLIAWTWFVVENSAYLRENNALKSHDWTTIVGVMTLIVAVFALGIRFFLIDKEYLYSFIDVRFVLLVGFLGVMCSFVGATLWNIGSRQLPTSVSGQISVLETVFGLIFVYTLESRLPNLLEFFGITLILLGVIKGISMFNHGELPCEKK